MTFEHWAILLTIFIAIVLWLHYKRQRGYLARFKPGQEVKKIWIERSYLQILWEEWLRPGIPALILGMIIGGAVW